MNNINYFNNLDYVYNIDCEIAIKEIANKSIDIIITDPPYGMEYHSNHYKGKNPHKRIENDNAFPVDIIKEFFRLAKKAIYIFCRWDNLHELPSKPKSFIVWDKGNWTAGDLEHEHGRMWEAIAFYPMEEHKFIKRIPDIIRCNKVSSVSMLHPTEKPIQLLSELIAVNEGDIILDPFAGSGTTGIAAVKNNRRFLGFEIDSDYCKLSNDRIAAEKTGLTLIEYKNGQGVLF